jgi:tetratricopeptide (TPR) repeat protein
MNGFKLLALSTGLLLGAGLMFGQKDPQPKSPKEVEALQAIQKATAPDDQIKAIENVLTTFADTEYKIMLLQTAMQIAEQKGDLALTTTYAERLLEADPKNVYADVTLASDIAIHTREFDLDKVEKLAKAEKYANVALENIKTYPKQSSKITDEQWDKEKKNLAGQAYAALGMIATTRKKYDDAVTQFKTALDAVSAPDPNTTFRLGEAYLKAGKFDDAIAQFDKVLSMPESSPQVKQYAQTRKADAAKLKGAAAPPAPAKP